MTLGMVAGALLATVVSLLLSLQLPLEPSRRMSVGALSFVPAWLFALWIVLGSKRLVRGLLVTLVLLVVFGLPLATSLVALR
jgi:hypothetical protein